MKEYIERAAALDICQKEYEERLRVADYCGDTVAWNIGGAIKNIPAADVAPVVHGEWLCAETDDEQFFLCSVCNNKEYWESNYCPECGAKMYEEQEEPTNGK